MITGIFHQGSGLGNQLHRFVGTKVLALRKGETHSMIAPDLFKGKDFMNLNLTSNETSYVVEYPSGRVVPESYVGVIDSEFQGEKDFINGLDDIKEWLKVESIEMPDDLCIINFRGGEYVGVPDLFLPIQYWQLAVDLIKNINPNMRFEVHTDDETTAQKFFPNCKVVQDIGLNWRSIRYAKYLILSNSSFAILPALLNENAELIIAPKYWAGYNKGYWQLEDNNYKKFSYIHHEN